ncbi:COG4223 family protein [Endobacterium cereale]|nr:mitofilin family membrane protein [Endobacterium cereale]MEB2847637.1 mitofilin family membrane protein [Endobacterium cereale]
MVSDKPPRRSKSDKSPVTIDLATEDVSTIATPVRSDDSDIPAAAAKTDAKAADAGKPVSAKDDTVTSKAEAAKPVDTRAAEAKPAAAGGTATGEVEPTKAAETPKTNATSSGPGTSAPTSAPTPAANTSSGSSAAASGNNNTSANTVSSSANTGSPRNFGTSTASASSTPRTSSTAVKPDPQPKPATASADATSAAKAPARQAPATSSLIAAGIFGGIVALALAGSMFYAGIIPGASSGNTNETAQLQQQIDSLNQQLTSSTAAIEALKTTATAADGGNVGTEIAERLAALESRIAEAGSNTAASDALTQRLAALETKVDQPGREEAVAKALAASALKTAIDRGGPFTGELQTFAGIAGNDPAVQTLEKFAQSGVPSTSDLVQKFPQTATTILNAAHQTDDQAGVGSRLLSSAMQMVKVRPVGDVEGDTPEAIVARMEDKLRKGDLKGASTEWDALPQTAKDASVAYKQTLDARIEVDGLVDNTLNRAISGASNAG